MLKSDENAVTHLAGFVDDGAVGDEGILADGYRRAGFGMDDHAILDAGVDANDNWLDVAQRA